MTRQKLKICCSPSGDTQTYRVPKPSMTFLCRDVISFISLSPSVETDDFMARSKWEISKLPDLVEATVGSIIVSVQSNKAHALHIKRNRFWKPVSFDQKFGRRRHQTTRRKPAEVSLLSLHFASSWETSASRERHLNRHPASRAFLTDGTYGHT